jgi:hypothetical protein
MTARLAPEPWSRAGVEPRVDDLINDPIVALVMRRDNLMASDLLEVAVRARALLRQPAAAPRRQAPPAGDVDRGPR